MSIRIAEVGITGPKLHEIRKNAHSTERRQKKKKKEKY
jgi:hypothetical protein